MASNIIKHANSKGIEMVAQTYVPLSQLQIIEPEEGNREEDKPHTKSFEDKIMENGMMDSIKVFPFNEKTQSYKVAEANHRVRGLNNIFQDDEDPMVPISILYWKDGEDPEEVKQTVIEFNVTGKAWTNYNFVRSHSESGHFPKDVQSLWKEIFNNMKINLANSNEISKLNNCRPQSLQNIYEETYSRLIKPFYITFLISISLLLILKSKNDHTFRKYKYKIYFFGFLFVIFLESSSKFISTSLLKNLSLSTMPIFFVIALYIYFLQNLKVNKK